MKKLTATLLATSLLSLAAFAQGTVNFANVGVGLNSPVLMSDGSTKVAATGFTAELLAGSSAASLASVATTGFLSAGYFNGGPVSIASVAPGSTAFLQVRIYSTASGSYQSAFNAGVANTYGISSVFQVATGGVGQPATPPATLTTLPSITLNGVPEPSSLALAGLGAAAMLVFRRRK